MMYQQPEIFPESYPSDKAFTHAFRNLQKIVFDGHVDLLRKLGDKIKIGRCCEAENHKGSFYCIKSAIRYKDTRGIKFKSFLLLSGTHWGFL
jgi:hypothetical protein